MGNHSNKCLTDVQNAIIIALYMHVGGKIMNRIVAITIALVTVLSFAFCMTGCGGIKYGNDTFEGALSETSYDNQEDAVKGFLSNEIAGEAAGANLVDYEEKKELTTEEIDQLVLGDVAKESIVSAKEVDISYNRDSIRSVSSKESEEDCFVFTVYILEISPAGVETHEFRYYVPKAKNGEALTRSYYKDLLDSEKYVNCTQEYVNKGKSTLGGKSISFEQKFVIKVAGNKAYMEMKVINPTSLASNKITYFNINGYFEYDEETDTFKTYLSMEGSPFTLDHSNVFGQYGVTDMESFATMNIPKIDYSYYEKTDFGFKIQEEFLNKYLGASVGTIAPGSEVDCELNFFVSGGKIGKLEANSRIAVDANGMKVVTESKETLIFKDFGTTVVETPELA